MDDTVNKSTKKLEQARKRHLQAHGHRSFKRARGNIIPKDIFGNCPDVAQRYEKIGRLGEGTYGVVYKALDKQTNQIVALKRCLPHFEDTDGFPLTTLREISVLRSLRCGGLGKMPHPSIVQLLDVAVSSQRKTITGASTSGSGAVSGVFLVFEYCNFDLAQLVDEHYGSHSKSPFNEAQVKNLASQLLQGLAFLHSRKILHRDIKLSNLLYSQTVVKDKENKHKQHSHLRIADFGLARRSPSEFYKKTGTLNSLLTPKVVSLWYRPPEILFASDQYNEAIDNWGAGCAIAELLKGYPLVKGRNEIDQISKIFELLGPPNTKIWPELKEMPLIKNKSIALPNDALSLSSGASLLDRFDELSSNGLILLSNLLKYNYKERWTSSQALQSDYFNETPLPSLSENMPFFHSDSKSKSKR